MTAVDWIDRPGLIEKAQARARRVKAWTRSTWRTLTNEDAWEAWMKEHHS